MVTQTEVATRTSLVQVWALYERSFSSQESSFQRPARLSHFLLLVSLNMQLTLPRLASDTRDLCTHFVFVVCDYINLLVGISRQTEESLTGPAAGYFIYYAWEVSNRVQIDNFFLRMQKA